MIEQNLKKFTNVFDASDWLIETDTGWEELVDVKETIPYEVWGIKLENGCSLKCADDHIVYDENMKEVFVRNLSLGSLIQTKHGLSRVIEISNSTKKENMYDLGVNSSNQRYYSNDILSHNTTTAVVILLHYALFNKYKTVALLSNKSESSRDILYRIQNAYEALPKWLQQGIEEWNKGSVEFENGSRIIAGSTSSSSVRGRSISFLYVDEAAFIDNFSEFFASVYPTISSGKESKLFLTSTPFGLNHFYETFINAKKGLNGYEWVEVKWHDVPGRDEAWKEETLKALDFDTQKFDAEFNVEFLGSAGNLLNKTALEEITETIKTPIMKNDMGVSQYEKPIKGHSYVMTCDVARGKELDYSAFQIIDVTDTPYRQVCVFRSNTIIPFDYATVINSFARLYNEAYVLVETNDIGAQVSESLHHDFEYENIVYTATKGIHGKVVTQGFGAPSTQVEKGVKTTKTVKSIGCSTLKVLIENGNLLIQDYDTVQEFYTFIRRGPSYEAEPGKHDDLVMSLMLFAWLSAQKPFTDMADINTTKALRERSNEEMYDQLTPFGLFDNGISDDDSGIIELNDF